MGLGSVNAYVLAHGTQLTAQPNITAAFHKPNSELQRSESLLQLPCFKTEHYTPSM